MRLLQLEFPSVIMKEGFSGLALWKKNIMSDYVIYAKAHFTVLQHMVEVAPYFEKYLAKILHDNIGTTRQLGPQKA